MAIQIPPKHRGDIIAVATKALRTGKVLCNFIEGRRNPERKLLDGKTGTVRMALAAEVPIIPLGITCPAGRTMAQSLRYLMSKQQTVQIAIGRPIRIPAPSERPNQTYLSAQTQRVMAAIAPLAGKAS